MKNIVLLGGGGHCRSTIEVIENATNTFSIFGILDPYLKITDNILGYPIIGDDSCLDSLLEKDLFFSITVGHIKNAHIREILFNKFCGIENRLPVIVSNTSFVSKRSNIKSGTVVYHNSVINSNTIIGNCTILNTASIIEHDVIIGNFCHISTGAIINGGVSIGNNVFIGSRSIVIQGICICDNVTIGAGSTVINNITESGIYVGCPARRIHE